MASNCKGLGYTVPGVDLSRPDLQVWIGSVWDKSADHSNEANSKESTNNLCIDLTQSPSSESDSSPLPYPPLSPSSLDAVQALVSLSSQGSDKLLSSADENSTDFPPARTPGAEALSPPSVGPSPTFPSMVESLMTTTNVDLTYSRRSEYPNFKPPFTPWNRAMLVMWTLKACEEFECHRETFHLAIDYLDRFIVSKSFNSRSDLALVTAGSLLVASKMESASFPKLKDYTDKVKDISCNAEDILLWEMEVLTALKYRLSPVTPNNWLGMFLQKALVSMECRSFFLDGQFSQLVFINVSRLIDISLMHTECIKFDYKIIAATALFHFTSDAFISNVSGLSVDQLADCIRWMNPMADAIKGLEPCQIRPVPNMRQDEFHTIQACNFGIEVAIRLYLCPEDTHNNGNVQKPEELLPKLSNYLPRQAFEEPEVNRVQSPPMESRNQEMISEQIPMQETRDLHLDPRDAVTPRDQILPRPRSEQILIQDTQIVLLPSHVIAFAPTEPGDDVQMSEEIPTQDNILAHVQFHESSEEEIIVLEFDGDVDLIIVIDDSEEDKKLEN